MAKIPHSLLGLLDQYLKVVKEECPIDRAVLFGSYANQSYNKHSDIDLAIFSRKITDKNRLSWIARFLQISISFGRDIQPIAFPYKDYIENDNDFIVEEIKKKGIVIQ